MPNLRTDILEQKDFILQCISEHKSKAYICKILQCKPETLNRYLKIMNIEYSGNMGLKGHVKSNSYINAEEYAKKESGVKSHILKTKLIRENIKEYKCERCGLSTWLDQPIPLELHHIDGNHYNNDFNNLKLLCPNCHAMENNNSGAGTLYNKQKESHTKKSVTQYYCTECGQLLKEKTKTGLCASCYKTSTRLVERPEKFQLAQEIVEIGFCAVGRKYGVIANTIRRWCKSYGLPTTKNELKEWLKNN